MSVVYWIALNAVKGLGPVRIKQLCDEVGSPQVLFEKASGSLRKRGLLTDALIAQIQDPQLLADANEQIERAERLGVRILTPADQTYPPVLKEIFAPPPVMYVKGSVEPFQQHSIAIVGMRQPSTYGKNATEQIVDGLLKQNITIVSGLALGIDAVAHKACVDKGGLTVAVLGCGVDKIYPSANKQLAEQILSSSGALVSEFPLGTPPLAYNFPRRNRIISGLSAGVLVIEARSKSGSLITAHYAMQQGRDVFAVPGSIFSEKSDGTFNLIKNGAAPVRKAQDILDTITTVTNCCVRTAIVSKVTQIPLDLLSGDERLVFEILTDQPLRIDQIAEKIEQKVADLFTILLNLELKGIVRQVAGQQYMRV